MVGPIASARVGQGTVAVAGRVGAAFDTIDLEVAEAVDVGLGWDVDEADLVARWAARGDISVIGLAFPKPSARLASALREVAGRIPIIVADPLERPWQDLGAALVPSLEALRVALQAPPVEAVALVGSHRPTLDALELALVNHDTVVVHARDAERQAIAEEVHLRAELGSVLDLTAQATARHAQLAARTMNVPTITVGVDGGILRADRLDPHALARGLRARREAQRAIAREPLPSLSIDYDHAAALLTAALMMKRTTLSREEALAFAHAMRFGRPASTLQVASVAAARAAGARLGWPTFIGAPGVSAILTTESELDDAWAAIERATVKTVDPYVARWVAGVPRATPFRFTVTPGPVAPLGWWQIGSDEGRVTLPLRRGDAEGPEDLFAAASRLVRTFADLERFEVRGSYGPEGIVIADASVVMPTL